SLRVQLDYTRSDPTQNGLGVTEPEIQQGLSGVSCQITTQTGDPLPNGKIWHRIVVDLDSPISAGSSDRGADISAADLKAWKILCVELGLPEPAEDTGSFVRALREYRGWTQEDLASYSGLSLEIVRRVEGNWHRTGVEPLTWWQLCVGLGLSEQ